MEAGTEIKIGGQYVCLYHLKNKIIIGSGSILPSCNFAGENCNGNWHLLKAIKEKTPEEIQEERNSRRRAHDKRRSFDKASRRKLKEPKSNKWDFEKW